MIGPLPDWSIPLVEGEIKFPDGTKATITLRATKPFRAWLESLQAAVEDHETRIEALEP